jgi:hypothetical protein
MGGNSAFDVGTQPLQYANISNTLSQLPTSINNLQSSQSLVNPTVNTQLTTPTAAEAQAGAATAASWGPSVANNMWNVGQSGIQSGQSILPYSNQLFQSAFDPQNQLYNWLQNQNMQQTNAQNAATGVGTTPYGAAVADQSNMLFNLNWQNNLLGREESGSQAAGNLLTVGNNLQQSGVNLEESAPAFISGTSAIPYATQSNITGTGLQDIATGTNIGNIPITDLLALLTGQNQTNQVGNQTSQLGLNQSALGMQQLAGLIGGGSSLFGGLLGGTGTGLGSLGSGLGNLAALAAV